MASMAGDRLPWDDEIDAHVEIDLASARLARELRDSARRVIGLLPASRTTPVQSIAKQLAIAFSRLTRKQAVILDPEALSVAKERVEEDSEEAPRSHTLFASRRIDPLIVVCAPERAAPPGAKAELLKLMLRHVGDQLPHGIVFVDMSGLVWPGEMLGAQARLDGVIITGHAGRTREPELTHTARRVPPELSLGVLLGE
jgi:hypothetical protein